MFQEFAGPIEAYRRLREMDRVFTSLDYTSAERVRFSAYQLLGSAQDWWRVTVSDWDRELPITWEDFRDEFLERYFPVDLHSQKENRVY